MILFPTVGYAFSATDANDLPLWTGVVERDFYDRGSRVLTLRLPCGSEHHVKWCSMFRRRFWGRTVRCPKVYVTTHLLHPAVKEHVWSLDA